MALEGIVVPSELGPFPAPASGRTAVWAHLIGWKTWGDSTRKIFDESSTRPFYLDDGSGALARVEPTDALVRVERDRRTHHSHSSGPSEWNFRGAMPREPIGDGALRLLRSRGRDPDDEVLTMSEDVIAPGDTLVVVGPSRPVDPSERVSPRSHSLLVARRLKPDRSLFLATPAFAGRPVPGAVVLAISAIIAAALLLLIGFAASST